MSYCPSFHLPQSCCSPAQRFRTQGASRELLGLQMQMPGPIQLPQFGLKAILNAGLAFKTVCVLLPPAIAELHQAHMSHVHPGYSQLCP